MIPKRSKKQKIDDFLEHCSQGLTPRYLRLVKETLMRLPKQNFEHLIDYAGLSYIGITNRKDEANAHAGPDSITFCKPAFDRMPDEIIIGIIAHELAHVVSWEEPESIYIDPEKEEEVNRLACEWSFSKEIEKMKEWNEREKSKK